MKKNLLLAVFALVALSVSAQNDAEEKKAWTKGMTTSLNFSQVAFSNWAAGGVNSIAFNGFVKSYLNYDKGIHHWNSTANFEYGLVRTSDIDYTKISNDKIDIQSKYGVAISEKFRVTASFSFLSQFTSGFDYNDCIDETKNEFRKVSSFMAPGYIQFGFGMDYVPVSYFSMNISPLMSKFTIVTIEELQTKYGNDSAQVCKTRFGGQVSLDFKKDIIKNVTLQTGVKAFFDYLDEEGYNPVVNWDLAIVMKINKFMSANIGTSLIWDKDILFDVEKDGQCVKEPRLQFKELFGIGVIFTL